MILFPDFIFHDFWSNFRGGSVLGALIPIPQGVLDLQSCGLTSSSGCSSAWLFRFFLCFNISPGSALRCFLVCVLFRCSLSKFKPELDRCAVHTETVSDCKPFNLFCSSTLLKHCILKAFFKIAKTAQMIYAYFNQCLHDLYMNTSIIIYIYIYYVGIYIYIYMLIHIQVCRYIYIYIIIYI